MKKIEIIWRELLFQAIEKGNRRFTQKDLAKKFGFSTSTVFQALKNIRKMGAVRVTGRFFILEDPEKLLYHWASFRDLEKDVVLAGRIDSSVLEIESRVPPDVVFGGYAAARHKLVEPPADYDKVYIYVQDSVPTKTTARRRTSSLKKIRQRFPLVKGYPNFFVLRADPFLSNYGPVTTLGQTFVDLWNLPDWYAKEFVKALKEKIDELLSPSDY